ncbi:MULTISPECIES: M14 metallopeptidase family protein [unclassified Spirosoma]|uniref:M14 family metallopeptidase n=1 Tax=unclassified Spirosoma TaxID=2621999 RepID=UPI00095AC1BC|nr:MULTISPECIES: M14 metallopeptidase family protein [unclassified Spirosoma]MBN8821008.1 peptidase [Spirosoma sp.]OJW76012.1 MAG: peptidase [Spirosoma sp. 48-14]
MRSSLYLVLVLLTAGLRTALAQTLPSPKEHFGFNIGDDYQLATYTQTEAYVKKLAAGSDRTKLVDIGLTEEGRHQFMLIVSSPENLKKLDRYKEISTKMARAEGLSEEQARALANEGKAVVWIDGGLHATEVVGTHQLIETIWQLVSRKDPETMRILDNCIILLTHANPDGQELVTNWYMRDAKPEKRSLENLPRLYEKYAGHDNNRDFFMLNLKETQNIGRQLFIEWLPQIMYNHHQRGPAGSVLAGPPYRDPFNYVFDPLMVTGIDALGAAMINRMNAENKPGYTRLGGSVFSTWYNGGLRTTTHFHNMIGLLTEIIGGPTPEDVPLVPSRLIPNGNTPLPVRPQKWHFKQSIDYSVSLNYAVLDYATRHHDELLFNIYRMGKNSIERGSQDTWSLSPKKIDAINTAFQADPKKPATASANQYGLMPRGGGMPMKYYDTIMTNQTLRDPRGFIIPANQPDFSTAVKFVNALIRTGIQIQQATADFTVAGKKYPAGSYVVKADQSFRPHLLDMFEPQDHPNDFQYPGGPPVRPYDAAGWTPAYLMNVKFDRILEGFDGPFKKLPYGELQSPEGHVAGGASAGYLLSAKTNNSFIAVNDLLASGIDVYRLPNGTGGKPTVESGAFFVPASAKAKSIIDKSVKELSLDVTGVSKKPTASMIKVSPMRIALWDTYGGSMPSGWIRWMMEQYHFPMKVVYPQDIDAGDLRKKFDVIVFVTRAIPALRGGENDPFSGFEREPKEENTPAEYRPWLGKITANKSIPQLKAFLEAGGNIVTIGSSTNLAYHLGLPVKNALTDMAPSGQERPLPGEKYYIPGSVLQVTVDSTQQATYGLSTLTDVYFDASPVFKLAPEAIAKGTVTPLAWFATNKPLRSGWAWGQAYLQDGVAAFMAPVGAGKLYAFGPEITFRAQSHGTFKLLFNQLYGSGKNGSQSSEIVSEH